MEKGMKFKKIVGKFMPFRIVVFFLTVR